MDVPDPYRPPSSEASAPPPPPAKPGSAVDMARCLGFFFQDPDWVRKLLLGSLFSLLTFFFVGIFFLAGYMMRLIRRSARGEPHPLPEWDDLGRMFAEGASAVGAYLAYILPAIGIVVIAMIAMPAVGGRGRSAAAALVAIALAAVFSVLVLAVVLYVPAAMARLAVEQRFGAALEIEENLAFIKRNLGNYVLALAVFLLANFLSQFGILLCCVGLLPASFWATCVGACALGEVALRDTTSTVFH